MTDSSDHMKSFIPPSYTILTTTFSSIKVFDPLLEDDFVIQPLNDSDSLLIRDLPYHRKATILIEGVIIPIFGFIGIIGNIASIIHFGSSQRRRHNFHAYMFYLGIVDLFLIILSLILHSAKELTFVHELFSNKDHQQVDLGPWVETEENSDCNDTESEVTKMSKVGEFLQYHSVLNQIKVYMIPIYSILISMNICIHLVISVERYLVINRPFLSIKCKKYQPWAVFTSVIVFATLYNLTKFFEHKLVYTEMVLPNFNIRSCTTYDNWFMNETVELAEICATELRRNQIYIHFMSLTAFLLMGLIPYVTILVINILILRRLIKHREWAEEGNQDMELEEMGAGNTDNGESRNGRYKSVRRQIQTSINGRPQIHYHSDRRRRNDVLLAKLSLVIMIPYLLYHSVRIIPNVYELTKV